MIAVQRSDFRKDTLGVLFVKAYGLAVLYVFFLQTELPSKFGFFVFQRSDQTRAERLVEIEDSFAERLAPYDGQFYLDIATHGYRRFPDGTPDGIPGNYAWFPLLPLVLRGLGTILSEPLPAAIVFNVLASCAGVLVLWRLARSLAIDGRLVAGLILLFPTAVFQHLFYTESFFLLLSVVSVFSVLRGRSLVGASAGYLAAICRPPGILLAIVPAVELFRRWRQGGNESGLSQESNWRRLALVAAVLAPVLGWATVAVVNSISIGSPWGFLDVQRYCGRSYSVTGILTAVESCGSYTGPVTDVGGVILGLGLLPVMWLRLPRSLAAYGTAFVLLPLATGTPLSMGRFLSVSFPHFLALGVLLKDRPKTAVLLLAVFVILQLLLAKAVVAWRFVG